MRRFQRLGKFMSNVLVGMARSVLLPIPAWPKAYALGRFIDKVVPIHTQPTNYGPLKFFCPGHNPVDRAFQLYTKEPDTIAWLDGMREGDVLWDIGANVGMYTLYAAKKGVTVCAFEPEASNYWILNRNLDINELQDRVDALNVALSNKSGLTTFFLSKVMSGTAKHPGLSSEGRREHRRTAIGYTGRDIARIFDLPSPTSIKIDVDGHELAVLQGLDLEDQALRQLQVEVRDNSDAERIFEMLGEHGFQLIGSPGAEPPRVYKATNFRFARD